MEGFLYRYVSDLFERGRVIYVVRGHFEGLIEQKIVLILRLMTETYPFSESQCLNSSGRRTA